MAYYDLPKGTKHTPTTRRTLTGKRVPITDLERPTWEAIVGAPERTSGASQRPTHPSRKHDVEAPEPALMAAPVQGPTPALRRRERRRIARLLKKVSD